MSVLAIDISSEFTKIAAELSEKSGFKNKINHVTGDLLKIENYQFDGVVSFLCFCHVEKKNKLFENISKNMKSGAVIYFEDLILVKYFNLKTYFFKKFAFLF